MDLNEKVNADAVANVDERVMTIAALIFPPKSGAYKTNRI
jgi:hypothetical protein